jgi:hypothetical protein
MTHRRLWHDYAGFSYRDARDCMRRKDCYRHVGARYIPHRSHLCHRYSYHEGEESIEMRSNTSSPLSTDGAWIFSECDTEYRLFLSSIFWYCCDISRYKMKDRTLHPYCVCDTTPHPNTLSEKKIVPILWRLFCKYISILQHTVSPPETNLPRAKNFRDTWLEHFYSRYSMHAPTHHR